MLDRNIAAQVLAKAVSTGADFAQLFVQDRLDHNMLLRSNVVQNANTGRLHGAGIRLLVNTQQIYVYTNDTTLEGLLHCAGQAAAAVNRPVCCTPKELQPLRVYDASHIKLMPDTISGTQRKDILRMANAAARNESAQIVQFIASLSDSIQHVLVANTEGVFAMDTRVRTRLGCQAVAGNGTENQIGYEAPGACMGYELFDTRVDPAVSAATAAKSALTMLHAPVCPAGVMPVAIDNGFGGVIFHEACGHSLQATSVAYGLSEFSGKLGQQIAATCVTAVDDGTIPGEWGSIRMDDEGTPSTNLTLIENGILRNYMIDKLGGRRMDMPVTGSSRRQGYKFAPTSRMRNTYIAAGNDDNDEIIASMGDGLYARKMGGGSVNPATGEFNFAVSEGYLVRNGKIDHPVRGASLIGRGGEVLMKIDRVGKNMTMGQGMCGSISGSVPTNVGQPMIRVSSLTVGGGK